MSSALKYLYDAERVAPKLARKFSTGSWHITAVPLAMASYPVLWGIVEQTANKRPSLPLFITIEVDGEHGLLPHLHFLLSGSCQQADAMTHELRSAGMDVHTKPVNGREHAHTLLVGDVVTGKPAYLLKFRGNKHYLQLGSVPPVVEVAPDPVVEVVLEPVVEVPEGESTGVALEGVLPSFYGSYVLSLSDIHSSTRALYGIISPLSGAGGHLLRIRGP